VSVNGIVIPHEQIAHESQHYPAATPVEAWHKAAEALIIRELLLQEARSKSIAAVPADDAEGRRETEEEASIRALIEHDVPMQDADDDDCLTFYQGNKEKFRAPALYDAAHILIAALENDDEATLAIKQRQAEHLMSELLHNPAGFDAAAKEWSACPSRENGGRLGQISTGQTVAEFESALKDMATGPAGLRVVQSRFGYHIVRLDRRLDGDVLPFALVRESIAAYLADGAYHRALANYVAALVAKAAISGVVLKQA
jgi:peptidyl-prolyl cis-trans isomerase C